MPTIPQVTQAMQTILTHVADTAARTTQFVQRTSKLGGAGFVQTLVFGFLANPQGLDQRMTDTGAACLQTVLEAAAATVLGADPVALPALTRFTGVYIQDSTTIGLPRTLAHLWLGSGNQHTLDGAAALKLGVRLNLTTGELDGPHLDHGVMADRRLAIQTASIPPGALRLADLGFFDLAQLAQIGADQGFWLTRLQVGTAVFAPDGSRVDLLAWLDTQGTAVVDQPVLVGACRPGCWPSACHRRWPTSAAAGCGPRQHDAAAPSVPPNWLGPPGRS